MGIYLLDEPVYLILHPPLLVVLILHYGCTDMPRVLRWIIELSTYDTIADGTASARKYLRATFQRLSASEYQTLDYCKLAAKSQRTQTFHALLAMGLDAGWDDAAI